MLALRAGGRLELDYALTTTIDGKTHTISMKQDNSYHLPCGKAISADVVQKGECIGIRLDGQTMRWSYPVKAAHQRDDGVIIAQKKIVIPEGGSLWLTPTTNLSHKCHWLRRGVADVDLSMYDGSVSSSS